jgi:hypothetical protein
MKRSLATSLPARLYAYSKERFPIGSYGTGVFLSFFSAYLVAQALADCYVTVGWDSIAGLATVLLVFYHLRIMDELKDAREDAQYHPERPVARGLVTLGELRLVGLVAIITQIGLNLCLGLPVFAAYLSVLLFSLLMYREFFLGQWLKRSVLLYGLSHMVTVPLIAFYIYASYAFRNNTGFHPAFGLYLALSFVVGLFLEIARKIRSPQEEQEGVDSYSRYFGTARATYVATGLVFLGSATSTGIGLVLGFTMYYYLGIWVLFAIAMTGFLRFRLSPTPNSARHLAKIYAPAYMAGVYLLMILAIVLDHEISLRLIVT